LIVMSSHEGSTCGGRWKRCSTTPCDAAPPWSHVSRFLPEEALRTNSEKEAGLIRARPKRGEKKGHTRQQGPLGSPVVRQGRCAGGLGRRRRLRSLAARGAVSLALLLPSGHRLCRLLHHLPSDFCHACGLPSYMQQSRTRRHEHYMSRAGQSG
jgi:hypothetical protein